MEKPLNQMVPGESAQVVRVDGPKQFVRRLFALGVAPGAHIHFVRKAPLGDPLQVRIAGSNLSIRHGEAEQVRVTFQGV